MKDKVALITGSANGLGKKTAIEFAKQGVHVAINYRSSREEALATSAIVNSYGVRSEIFQADVSVYHDCVRLIQDVLDQFGQIDILVNNAGPYMQKRQPLSEYSIEEWKEILDGNLSSFFYLTKGVLPGMRERNWGRIISMGFDRAETAPGWIYRSAFAAAKTGLVSLTRTLALEEAPHGITVNMVCPGDIRGSLKEADIDEARWKDSMDIPVGRNGTGEDIARTIMFLCENKSDYITGSVMPVTGGQDVLGKRRGQQL